MVIGVPGSLVGVASARPGRHNLMEISGTSPYPMDAFRLVTNGIDRAEHLLSVDCIVQNDPAVTTAQFHHLEPSRTRSPAGPAQHRHGPSARRRTPVPALISPTAPVEALISSTTFESSCTTSR
jgi:hypothetical protein